MRIAVISDIHADLIPNGRAEWVLSRLAESIAERKTDVLVIAGDQVNHHSLLSRYLRPLADAARVSLYVPGNHDVWLTKRGIRKGQTSFDALTALREAADKAGFHYLPGAPQLIDGWAFAGSLGWYDHGFADPSIGASAEMYEQHRWDGRVVWNDANFSRWERDGHVLRAAEVATLLREELKADLAAVGVNSDGGPPAVVATHTLPYSELLSYRDELWNFCNAFMGSPELGRLYDARPSIRVVVAGHTHMPRRLGPPEREVIVAPLGYYQLGEATADPAERVAFFEG